MSEYIRHINLTYDPSNSDSSARDLLFALIPEWKSSPGSIEFERFKDGITNTLFKAIKKRPDRSQRELDQEAILLRAYGNKTDVLIDREREARSHSLLARKGLAPQLLARFNNGLLYRFIEGSACAPDDLRKPDVWPAVARRLGQWHGSLPVEEAVPSSSAADHRYERITSLIPGKPVPNVWTVLQKWISALPQNTNEEKARMQTLQTELESSVKLLGGVSSLSNNDYVLSHTDLLSGNVVVHPESPADPSKDERTVSFIDYEYTTPAPMAFDLANHFAEWIGFDCDMNNIPTRAQRHAFITQYVQSFQANNRAGTSTSAEDGHTQAAVGGATVASDVDRLMHEVDLFRGMPGLYWGVWAIIQSTISHIDFDYVTYADTRLGEYWAWKAEETGSRKASGQELCLRERRWAQGS